MAYNNDTSVANQVHGVGESTTACLRAHLSQLRLKRGTRVHKRRRSRRQDDSLAFLDLRGCKVETESDIWLTRCTAKRT